MIGRLEQTCGDQGFRLTGKRRLIVQLLDAAEDHPTLEDIYNRAIQHDHSISITTVYRTIRALVEWGLLSRIELGDGKARYEDGQAEHHEHLIDLDTGKVLELNAPGVEDLLRHSARQFGYRLVSYRLELIGEASSKPARRSPGSSHRLRRAVTQGHRLVMLEPD
jgi:Fur family transcriptional regulator, ferric uptake regulator